MENKDKKNSVSQENTGEKQQEDTEIMKWFEELLENTK